MLCTLDVWRASPRQERHFLSSVAKLGYGNPFLPERITFEKAALGREFVAGGEVWSASVSDPDAEPPNVTSIYKKLSALMEVLPARLAAAAELREEERHSVRRERPLSALSALSFSVCRLRRRESGVSIVTFWRIGTGYAAFTSRAIWSPRTCSPASGRSSARFITSTTTSSATRCRRRDCARASGNPSSRTTCGATGACCIGRWATFPR